MAMEMEQAEPEIIDYGNEDELMQILVGQGHDCKICMEKVEQDAYLLDNCDHVLHKECLQHYLRAEIDNSKCPLNCPIPECKIVLSPHDMHSLMSEEEMERFQKYSFQQALGVQ
jgi:E3 ubiquitin-protein ligase RNF19B